MKDMYRMFSHSRMIVLTAAAALAYALGLYLFNFVIQTPWGLRPATCLPPAMGMLFGPAAAFGSVIGNLLFDLADGFDFGTPPGIIGNFLLAYIPYRGMVYFEDLSPSPRLSLKWIICYVGSCFYGSLACGVVIGFTLDGIGAAAFAERGVRIFLGNWAMALLLGPFILMLNETLHKRGWTYLSIMERPGPGGCLQTAGWVMVKLGLLWALAAGLLTFYGILPPLADYTVGSGASPASAPAMLPGVALFLLGVVLI